MAGAGVLAPSACKSMRLICATCNTRSPKDCCAGVGLKPNLSSGIALASPRIITLLRVQSFSTSQVRLAQAPKKAGACLSCCLPAGACALAGKIKRGSNNKSWFARRYRGVICNMLHIIPCFRMICNHVHIGVLMALGEVILTVLAHRSMTGYEIARNFDRTLSWFWRASHQQIYRELARLGRGKCVSFRVVPQQGKPDKKVYAITL